jgi:hypothetical protein
MVACVLGLLGAMPVCSQEPAFLGAGQNTSTDGQLCPAAPSQPPTSTCDAICPAEAPPWRTAWGLIALSAIPSGPKIAPNGEEYHPNFSLDVDVNFWLWRRLGLYMYGDLRLWGERSENGVTNGRDGFVGTSKREFDFSGGAAWNYWGPLEARFFGYTNNNLNRGTSQVTPTGFTDGFGMENRFYLSPEYAKLGQTGFDVEKATYVSIGYYPSKVMVGNDGQPFKPGLMLGAYLTYDLFDWPLYVYGKATYIGESSGKAKLLIFDLGLAARPFSACPQCEFRFGAESTGDFDTHSAWNLWYVSARFVF